MTSNSHSVEGAQASATIAASLSPNNTASDFVVLATGNEEDALIVTPPTSPTVIADASVVLKPDLWQLAWEKLKENDERLFNKYKAILDCYTKLPADSTLEEKLSTIISDRREAICDAQWTIKIGSKPKKVRAGVEKIVQAITTAKDLGTAAASLAPIHAGLPWAGICVLLPLVLNNFSQETLAVEGLEMISSIVTRCAQIEQQSSSRDMLSLLREKMNERLVKLYTNILRFEAQAASHFNHRSVVRVLRSTAKLDDWQGLLEKIRAADDECMRLRQIVDNDSFHRRFDKLDTLIERNLQQPPGSPTMIEDIEFEFDKLVNYLIKAKIQPPDYSDDLAIALAPQKEHPSSSTWILDHPRFIEWLAGARDRLWIHGRPGCGKSVLAAVIVDKLSQRPETLALDGQSASEYVGSVFCRDQTKRTSAAIMKILVCQLLDQLARSSLRPDQKKLIVLGWREIWTPRGIPRTAPFAVEKWLLPLLSLVLQSFRSVYLVIDGLDDCNDPAAVVREVQGFCSGASQICKLHVLFVSQKTAQVAGRITPSFQQIDLDTHDLRGHSDHDIDIVVSGILDNSTDPDFIPLSRQLTDWIIEKSDGMILWATLATRHLLPRISYLKPCNIETISSVIEEMPQGVEKLYADLLRRCFPDSQNPEIYNHVLNILRWVLWSTRPLRVDELEAALSCCLGEGSSTANSSTQDNGTDGLRFKINTLCSPLISIQQDDTVTIVHLTFKHFVRHWKGSDDSIRYILSQLSETESSLVMARTCLQYLNNRRFQEYQNLLDDIADSKIFSGQFCFFDYAALGWINHWNGCSASYIGDPTLVGLFQLLTREEQGLTWLERYRILANISLTTMMGLQAEVNRLTGPSGNHEWLVSLLRVTMIRKQGIFGKMVGVGARYTAISLALLYHDAGGTKKAKDLYSAVLLGVNSESKDGQDRIIVMNNLALVQCAEENFKDAEINMNWVVKARKEKFGDNSLPTARAMNNLACVYSGQRRFKEAETLFQRALQIRTARLGKYHRDTVSCRINATLACQEPGKLAEAKNDLAEIVERFPQKSSDDSLLVLNVKHHLATYCIRFGEYQEAAQLHLEVLQQRTIMLGETHGETLRSLDGLAVTYLQQARYKEAEERSREGVTKSRFALGHNHLHTLTQQKTLAIALGCLRQYKESRELHQITYEARIKALGQDNFNTLESLGHLASLSTDLGHYAEAEEQQAQVVRSCTSLYGPENMFTLDQLSKLAFCCHERGRYSMAAELGARVLERRRKLLGGFHPSSINALATLGDFKMSLGLWSDAKDCLMETLIAAPKVWNANHQQYFLCKRNLARIYRCLGQSTKAEEILVPLIESFKESFGENDWITGILIMDLASTYLALERFEESLVLAQRLLKTWMSILPKHHRYIVASQLLIGRIFYAQKNFKHAETTISTVMERIKDFFGEVHPITLTTANALACILRDKGDLVQAETILLFVVEKSLHRPGFWHPDTLQSIDDLSMLYALQRRISEGLEIQNIVFEARKKLLGPEHPASLKSELNLDEISNNERMPMPLTEKIRSIIPVWSSRQVQNQSHLVDIIRLASGEDYQYWILSCTAQEMEIVLGQDHWESIESRRQLALYNLDRGDFTSAVEPLKRAWRKHEDVFGSTDSRTLTRLFELSKSWKELGILSTEIRHEAIYTLSRTVKAGEEEFFSFLLEANVDPDQLGEDGITPLFRAVTIDRPISTSMVRQLLEAGASTK